MEYLRCTGSPFQTLPPKVLVIVNVYTGYEIIIQWLQYTQDTKMEIEQGRYKPGLWTGLDNELDYGLDYGLDF